MRKFLILAFLFLLTFFVRFYRLSETSLYPDEITWMVRAKETALAIRTSNFEFFKSAWWNIKDDTEAIALPLTISTGFPIIYLAYDSSVLSANLFNDYIVARTTVIFFVSIFIVLFYLGLDKLFNSKVALISSVLLSIDPIFLANSKMVMNDIYLTVFITLSFFLYLLIKNINLSSLVTGLLISLAFLSKPTGLVVLPILLMIGGYRKFIYIVFFFLLFTSILWPNSWTNPVWSIVEYTGRQGSLVSEGINNFYFGKITENPSLFYYPFQILIRFPLIVTFIFIVSIYSLIKHPKKGPLIYFLLFTILYVVIMSVSPKKLGIRYMLPIFPFVYIFVGSYLSRYKSIIAIFITLFMLINVFRFFPNHELYYNRIINPNDIHKYDLIGLCRGSKQSVDFILNCFPQVKSIGAVGCGSSVIPYYYPNHFDSNWKNKDVFFVESYYIQLNKDPELTSFIAQNTPTKVVKVNGLTLSYIYTKNGIDSLCN